MSVPSCSRVMSVLLCLCAMAALPSPLEAATGAATAQPASILGITVLPLYPDQPDGPRLSVLESAPTRGNGTAVIIAPGGGYVDLAFNHEGRQVADWFAARGVTAFVLEYRLGAGHVYPVPLQDGQQALARVRALAPRYRLANDRIGMVGFSAGGHLAALAATVEADLDQRPDFLVLGYPWLNAMQPNDAGLITYCSTVKGVPPAQCKAYEHRYTPLEHVSAKTPPVFIYGTTDDAVVSVPAITAFYAALLQAKVSVELHLFAHGAHGSGLGGGDLSLDAWPGLLENWLRARGLLEPAPGSFAAAAKAMAPAPEHAPGTAYTLDTRLADLLGRADTRAVLERVLGKAFLAGLPDYARGFSLDTIAVYKPEMLDPDRLAQLAAGLAAVDPD